MAQDATLPADLVRNTCGKLREQLTSVSTSDKLPADEAPHAQAAVAAMLAADRAAVTPGTTLEELQQV